MPLIGNVLFQRAYLRKNLQNNLLNLLGITLETQEHSILTTAVLRMWNCFSWSTNHFFFFLSRVIRWIFLSGWQCPASQAVNPSGWMSEPIVLSLKEFRDFKLILQACPKGAAQFGASTKEWTHHWEV